MSAEGDNNLDNDAAGDLIRVTSDALFDRILLLMRHPNGHEYDDQEIGELFFLVEVAFALNRSGLVGFTESADNISAEVEPYIKRWENYHIAAGHEPPQTRRTTMVETFDRLVEMISGFQSESHWQRVEDGECSREELDLLRKIFDYSDSEGNPK